MIKKVPRINYILQMLFTALVNILQIRFNLMLRHEVSLIEVGIYKPHGIL